MAISTVFNVDYTQNRIWLKFWPYKDGALLLLEDDLGKITDQAFKAYVTQLLIGVLNDDPLLIPLTGAVPKLTLKNTYERVIPDLSMTQRFTAGFGGGVLSKVGALAGDLASGFRSGDPGKLAQAGNLAARAGANVKDILQSVGSFVQQFQGSLDSPNIWNSTAVDPINFTGMAGFQNLYEYQYYKAIDFILTRMLTPILSDSFSLKKYIEKLAQDMNKQLLRGLDVQALNAPRAVCDIEVVSGKAFPLQAATAIVLDDDKSVPLLRLDNCLLSEAVMTEGTDDTHGFDDYGFSRMANFNLIFTPLSIKSVIDGLASVVNESQYVTKVQKRAALSTGFAARIPTTTSEILGGALYQILNVNLTATAAAYVGGKATLASGANSGFTTAASQAAGSTSSGRVDISKAGGIGNFLRTRVTNASRVFVNPEGSF